MSDNRLRQPPLDPNDPTRAPDYTPNILSLFPQLCRSSPVCQRLNPVPSPNQFTRIETSRLVMDNPNLYRQLVSNSAPAQTHPPELSWIPTTPQLHLSNTTYPNNSMQHQQQPQQQQMQQQQQQHQHQHHQQPPSTQLPQQQQQYQTPHYPQHHPSYPMDTNPYQQSSMQHPHQHPTPPSMTQQTVLQHQQLQPQNTYQSTYAPEPICYGTSFVQQPLPAHTRSPQLMTNPAASNSPPQPLPRYGIVPTPACPYSQNYTANLQNAPLILRNRVQSQVVRPPAQIGVPSVSPSTIDAVVARINSNRIASASNIQQRPQAPQQMRAPAVQPPQPAPASLPQSRPPIPRPPIPRAAPPQGQPQPQQPRHHHPQLQSHPQPQPQLQPSPQPRSVTVLQQQPSVPGPTPAQQLSPPAASQRQASQSQQQQQQQQQQQIAPRAPNLQQTGSSLLRQPVIQSETPPSTEVPGVTLTPATTNVSQTSVAPPTPIATDNTTTSTSTSTSTSNQGQTTNIEAQPTATSVSSTTRPSSAASSLQNDISPTKPETFNKACQVRIPSVPMNSRGMMAVPETLEIETQTDDLLEKPTPEVKTYVDRASSPIIFNTLVRTKHTPKRKRTTFDDGRDSDGGDIEVCK